MRAMKILVGDDDKMRLRVLSHNLGEEGYEVLVAENGLQALDILDKEKQNPDGSERKLLLDVARKAMGRVVADDAWMSDLRTAFVRFNSPLKTMNVPALKAALGAAASGPDCLYNAFPGQDP